MTKTQKQIIGDLGEGVVCNYLKNKGFCVIQRNYWKPWGEIDIIAKKGNILHFIEVKTVTRETNWFNSLNNTKKQENVNHETLLKVSRETYYSKITNIANVIHETIHRLFKNGKNVKHETSPYGTNSEIPLRGQFYDNVNRETNNLDNQRKIAEIIKIRDKYRPEDNLHSWKLKRLSRVIQTYLMGNSFNDENGEVEWQFDIATVYLGIPTKQARVEFLEDVVL